MKSIVSIARSIAMAFMTFSRVPMPRVEWEERSMRYMLAAFPLVGLVVAALAALWVHFACFLGLSSLVVSAGLLAVPLFVTGGIHLDGFCDVTDALSSHADPERKCQIMKDPHVGAFSVMFVGLYLIAYFAVCSDLGFRGGDLLAVCFIYPATRALSGLLCLLNDRNSSDGMVSLFKRSASQRACVIVLLLELCLFFAIMALGSPVIAAVLLAVAIAVCLIVRSIAKRQFGGVNGDVAGFFLQVAEFSMLASVLVIQKVMLL